MNKILILLSFILPGLKVVADIAPNPIQAKGISTNCKTEIKMAYEKVTVDLTLDSSFVHCYFKLHNEGNSTNIQIGYPNMNYSYRNSGNILNLSFDSINSLGNQREFNRIYVYENGLEIGKIHFYSPNYSTLLHSNNYDMPWYLWDTHFNKDETKIIEISYSLPRGNVKNQLYYYFEYLLSTGTGWKGNIDTAEIYINLKNIDNKLLLKTKPLNFISSENKIIWKFYNFKPSEKDNISILYEKEKGDYSKRLKQVGSPVVVWDNSKILNNSIFSNDFSEISPDELATIIVLRNIEKVKTYYPNIDTSILDCSQGFLLLYSKKFAIEKINRVIKSLNYKSDTLYFSSIPEFDKIYSIKINDKQYEDWDRFHGIVETEFDKFISISIKKLRKGKKEIDIKTEE